MSEGWRSWSLDDWNHALFHHVFASRGQDAGRPVVRIPVTPEVLAAAAGASQADAAGARRAFVGLFRVPPKVFNRLFVPPLVTIGWDRSDPPPFFAQLVLTLLVASAGAETLGEGNFRARLAIELGHPEGTPYPLSGLPELWSTVREWLSREGSVAGRYRGLVLPDPGLRDKFIGISKRLAFPAHRDYLALTRALADARLDVESSPVQIIDAVHSSQARFSNAFLELFDEFVGLYRRGKPEARDHPFWSAVRSISWEAASHDAADSPRHRYALHLSLADLTTPSIALLTNQRWDAAPATGLSLTELRPPVREMTHVVASRGPEQFLERVFKRTPPCPNFARSQLAATLEDGCMCFADDESGERISFPSPPEGEETYLAVDGRRFHAIVGALTRRQFRPVHCLQVVRGWHLLGPIPSELLAEIGLELEGVDQIRCLLPRLAEPSISLRNTCRVGSSYLFRPGTYPDAACRGADRLVARVLVGEEQVEIALAAAGQESPAQEQFSFPPAAFELVAPPRQVELVAMSQGAVLARRRFHACRSVTATDYKFPPDLSGWMWEGAGGHLVGASDSTPATARHEDGTGARAISRGVIARDAAARPDEFVPAPLTELSSAWSGLLEVIAGLSLARQGMTEAELIHVIRQCVAPEPRWLVWDIARSLVENFQLECLTARRWSGRRYFAVRPCILWEGMEETAWAIGLLPELSRTRLQEWCREVGVAASFSHGEHALTVGPIRLRGVTNQSIAMLASSMHVPIRRRADLFLRPTPPLCVLTEQSEPRWSDGAGSFEQSYWDWQAGHFRDGRSGGDVSLRRRVWRDRPDEYEVAVDETRETWVTRSRTWALIVAHALAGKVQFKLSRDGTIRRPLGTQGHIPLPAARALLLEGGRAGGVHARPGEAPEYGYPVGCIAAIEETCGSLLIRNERSRSSASAAVERWRSTMPSRPQLTWPKRSEGRTPVRYGG